MTVIITCYNYGKFVGEAIESVLNQTLKPKEIIVINDGSTDDSLHVINKYKDKVTIIDKINEGVVVAKNTGIKKSKTYWTLFLDADDYLREDALERYVYGARVNNASVVYSGMTYFGAISDYFGSRRFNIIDLLKLNFIHNSALIKTSLLKISGGYKSEMNKGLEDWELYVTLYEHGARFSWVPEGLLFYRQHEKTENRNSEALELNNELIGNIRTIHAGLYQRYRFIIRIPMKLRNKLAICLKNPEIIFVIPIALVKSVLGKRSVIHYIRAYLNKKYLYLRDF